MLASAAFGLALVVSQALAAGPEGTKTRAAKAAATPAVVPTAVPDEAISPAQLEIAPRVLIGRADCEFGQHIDIAAVDGRPGMFRVSHGKNQYMMVPQETTTGAVRLEDHRTGEIWLQIPAKSMLINARAGHREVDMCQTSEQRASGAGVGIGIVAGSR